MSEAFQPLIDFLTKVKSNPGAAAAKYNSSRHQKEHSPTDGNVEDLQTNYIDTALDMLKVRQQGTEKNKHERYSNLKQQRRGRDILTKSFDTANESGSLPRVGRESIKSNKNNENVYNSPPVNRRHDVYAT